jgi:hypothetical protein
MQNDQAAVLREQCGLSGEGCCGATDENKAIGLLESSIEYNGAIERRLALKEHPAVIRALVHTQRDKLQSALSLLCGKGE